MIVGITDEVSKAHTIPTPLPLCDTVINTVIMYFSICGKADGVARQAVAAV